MKRLPFKDEFVSCHGEFGKGFLSASVRSVALGRIHIPFSEKFGLSGILPRGLHAGLKTNLDAKIM